MGYCQYVQRLLGDADCAWRKIRNFVSVFSGDTNLGVFFGNGGFYAFVDNKNDCMSGVTV